MEEWKTRIDALLESGDYPALVRLSKEMPARTLRHLNARLYSEDSDIKFRAVRALGAIAAEPGLLADEKLAEQLRRYLWSLNDESGAVPFGVPEAIGEILAHRPSLQKAFLPLICAMLYEEDLIQTGAIEQGVVWAIGRVGAAALACNPDIFQRVASMAAAHPDPQTRHLAKWALGRLAGGG